MTSEHRFTATMKGVAAGEISVDGLSLAHLLSGLDIHLRAGERPTVVLRPAFQHVQVDLQPGEDGITGGPRFLLAPDTQHVLETVLGWMSPDEAERLRARVEYLDRELEAERTSRAKLEEELADARGRLADLELAVRAERADG